MSGGEIFEWGSVIAGWLAAGYIGVNALLERRRKRG